MGILSFDMPFVLAHPHIAARSPVSSAGQAEDEEMQSQNRFFDDLARVAAGAMSTLSGVRGEVESRIREQLERVLAGMDLVSRDEFEAVKAMAAKARSEQEDLEKRVTELESRVAALSASQSAANGAGDQTTPGLSGLPGV
jgi:BMFP domain-containing protein YqiC